MGFRRWSSFSSTLKRMARATHVSPGRIVWVGGWAIAARRLSPDPGTKIKTKSAFASSDGF